MRLKDKVKSFERILNEFTDAAGWLVGEEVEDSGSSKCERNPSRRDELGGGADASIGVAGGLVSHATGGIRSQVDR